MIGGRFGGLLDEAEGIFEECFCLVKRVGGLSLPLWMCWFVVLRMFINSSSRPWMYEYLLIKISVFRRDGLVGLHNDAFNLKNVYLLT